VGDSGNDARCLLRFSVLRFEVWRLRGLIGRRRLSLGLSSIGLPVCYSRRISEACLDGESEVRLIFWPSPFPS